MEWKWNRYRNLKKKKKLKMNWTVVIWFQLKFYSNQNYLQSISITYHSTPFFTHNYNRQENTIFLSCQIYQKCKTKKNKNKRKHATNNNQNKLTNTNKPITNPCTTSQNMKNQISYFIHEKCNSYNMINVKIWMYATKT